MARKVTISSPWHTWGGVDRPFCARGLRKWDVEGAKRLRIVVSNKPPKDGIYQESVWYKTEVVLGGYELIGFDSWQEFCRDNSVEERERLRETPVYWWPEIEVEE